MISTLLGGLSTAEFLSKYWQKKPLLVRQAVPGFTGVYGLGSAAQLFDLARRDEVESRFVCRAGDRWTLAHGPFDARRTARKHPGRWTVLVQGVNEHLAAGDALMRRFDFIPYARLDDLMVSYAVDGGGVGPHFDSYDVFLLQGIGQRRWRIGTQRDKRLVDGLPLRILRQFTPRHDWTLNPGDLLYLPPQWAHDGVAVGACMTWSIGFRAPPAQELADQFLTYLQDTIELPGRYADPDLATQKHPAEIGAAMVDQVESVLARIKWNRATVSQFLGRHLTEPKANVFFDVPQRPLSARQFAARCRRHGLRLDGRSRLLFHGQSFFMNGESCRLAGGDRAQLMRLADQRGLQTLDGVSATLQALIYQWYVNGYLQPQ